jgi:hypothetical protein
LLGREYQAPQGEAEAVLADIWQDLLELECVGRNDHFFELGGHSLLALTMADRLRQRGWNLSAREVFARPLLADLAAVIDDDEANDWIPANLISDPFPLSANTPMEEFRL